MADTVDINRLNDEDIDSILHEIEMGTFDEDSTPGSEDDDNSGDQDSGEENLDNGADDNLDDDANDDDNNSSVDGEDGIDDSDLEYDSGDGNNENDEDTDLDDDSDDDDDTNGEDDDSGNDTSDDADDDSEENAQVKNTDDNDDGDNAETDAKDGDSSKETVVDPKEFEKYKDFYDKVVNAEFKANGKTVKGFSDPDKIIQSQQMSYGFSDKMAGFKKYRPFMEPLKKNGMLDDPEKFNLAMDLISGDKEAIKQHIKNLEIDPIVDLDLETVDYNGNNHVASKESIAIEDAMETARNLGVEDRVRDVIGKQWDDDSFNEFVSDPNTRRDLINHMASGVYDTVQDKISEIKRLDGSGEFSSLKSTDQYRAAVRMLQQEARNNPVESGNQPTETKPNQTEIEAEKQRIIDERKQAEYKKKAEQEKRKVDAERKRAASLSKKKGKTTKKQEFDPMKLNDADLDSFVDGLISGEF